MDEIKDRQWKSAALGELAWRGMIKQQTHDELDDALASGPLTLYGGFDPSADSLHAGNLVTIFTLAHFQRWGHDAIALFGGATGLIGDPGGKSSERNLLARGQVEQNLKGQRAQLESIAQRVLERHPVRGHKAPRPMRIVNNIDWLGDWNLIEFLRDIGKHFRVNQMLQKDSVRDRIANQEEGISFTEFSYMLMQAADFLHLYDTADCVLQVGGSDQWGNITAGVDLIRRVRRAPAFGLTFPLLTDASGKKYGKSEAGAIWLDAARTSPYLFYQHWVGQGDQEMANLLRTFTFLERAEVEEQIARVERGENRGEVQRKLAYEITALVHGEPEADRAVRASRVLFGEPLEGIEERDLLAIFADVPSTIIDRAELEAGLGLIDLLVRSGAQPSKGAARRLLAQGGVYVNNERAGDDPDRVLGPGDRATESLLVLRSGKKSYRVIRIA